MDPQKQFRQRYNEYVSQRSSQIIPTNSSTPSSSKKFSPNKFYVLGIIVGLLIVAPVASYLYLTNKMTTGTSQVAENKRTTITKPSEKDIDNEMMKIWGKYYEENKNDPKLREVAKQNIIKERLIVQGIAENKIQMSSIASDNPLDQELRSEDALKQKVLNNKTIDYAFVFINPDSSKYESDVEKIMYSYNLIKQYIAEGDSMEKAYERTKIDPNFYDRITITTDKIVYEDSFDKTISDQIFKYTTGQTTNVIDSQGGTFILAHINNSNKTPYSTLEEWLNAQK